MGDEPHVFRVLALLETASGTNSMTTFELCGSALTISVPLLTRLSTLLLNFSNSFTSIPTNLYIYIPILCEFFKCRNCLRVHHEAESSDYCFLRNHIRLIVQMVDQYRHSPFGF